MAIVKILARHSPSYASLIGYILNEAKTRKTEIYTQNLRGKSIDEQVKEFLQNEAFRRHRRSSNTYMYHDIVSFNANENNDVLTKEVIGDLAQEYMRLRGHTGIIVGAAHRDRNHVHLHFMVSGLHYRTGMSFGMNRTQLSELKQAFQAYHRKRYPEISHSFPEHGKGKEYASHSQWHAKQRDKIIETVTRCFAEAKSQRDFLELLRAEGLHHYERVAGKPTGIEYEGAKFRFAKLLGPERLEMLPTERSEEDLALEEIRLIRDRQRARERDGRGGEERAR